MIEVWHISTKVSRYSSLPGASNNVNNHCVSLWSAEIIWNIPLRFRVAHSQFLDHTSKSMTDSDKFSQVWATEKLYINDNLEVLSIWTIESFWMDAKLTKSYTSDQIVRNASRIIGGNHNHLLKRRKKKSRFSLLSSCGCSPRGCNLFE
ncbi:hypothetical protein ACOME3_001104 [Neoechinorhynchus agilis]